MTDTPPTLTAPTARQLWRPWWPVVLLYGLAAAVNGTAITVLAFAIIDKFDAQSDTEKCLAAYNSLVAEHVGVNEAAQNRVFVLVGHATIGDLTPAELDERTLTAIDDLESALEGVNQARADRDGWLAEDTPLPCPVTISTLPNRTDPIFGG